MNASSDIISNRRVLITGAGSGTGAAAALAIAATHEVVLVGRREDRLQSVAASVRERGGRADVVACDLTATPAAELLEKAGPVTDIVCAAGLNTPRRAWNDIVAEEFRAIVSTNLTSVAELVSAALPALRAARGTVVIVSSLSAWMTSPGAGVAYRASKMGLRALSDGLNEQEAVHGVRASLVLPGDIDSDFLSLRPQTPDAEARRKMLSPDDVASAIAFALDAPRHLRIDELVITPLGTVDR